MSDAPGLDPFVSTLKVRLTRSQISRLERYCNHYRLDAASLARFVLLRHLDEHPIHFWQVRRGDNYPHIDYKF